MCATTHEGTVFALNRFSVAICTRNRASLLERVVDAVFRQDYPHELYEVVIVDNGSVDGTAEAAARLTGQSPVPFRLVHEPEAGVSRARNRAATEAAYDFVAFLDDDTVPASGWLRALDAAIEEHGALVVGGRVEDVYEAGFARPPWLECRYLRGFFRLDYDGQKPPSFRVRYPDYIGEGNCVYSRRLFERHRFPTSLGHAGKRRATGEGAFLNRVLELDGVPIYYSDAAVVDHQIDPTRVTKGNLARSAYLHGVELARIELAFHGGARHVLWLAKNQLLELKRNTSHPPPFCTLCKLVRTAAFLLESTRLLATGGAQHYVRSVRGV